MALSFPLALNVLSECLTGDETGLELVRFDEHSGSGDGRTWTAQLAQPLWRASYELYARSPALARRINALVYALDGGMKETLWSDPFYTGPVAGTKGSLANAKVSSVRSTDRGALGLDGLPAGQVISAGDLVSISYASGRVYLGTFAEQGTANASGVLSAREIRPYLPIGIGTGAAVELLKPVVKMGVTSYRPFNIRRGLVSSTASITLMQKP